MSWRDRLRPASFDGLPFFVLADQLQTGKRAGVHLYPEREGVYVEELGSDAQTFPVRGHLLGDDVYEQRDRMVARLRAPGARTLILPSRREMQVVCLQIRETVLDGGEGRIARLDLEFVESGFNAFPTATADTGAAVRQGVPSALAVLAETFTELFDVLGLPGWVSDAAEAAADVVLGDLEDTIGHVATDDDLSDALRGVRRARQDLDDLVGSPSELAEAIQEPIQALAALTGPAEALYDVLRKLHDAVAPAPAMAGGTPSRRQDERNRGAISRISRRSLASALANVALRLTPDSAQDAALLREDLGGLLLEEADDAAAALEDDDFRALSDLASAVITDLDARAARLPERRTITVPETVSALVLAYRLHGDVTREADIVARNGIRRPGFIGQGTALEVVGGSGP